MANNRQAMLLADFFLFFRLIYVTAEKHGSLITSSRCDEVLIPEWPKASG